MRVQLEHLIATVNLDKDQPSVRGGALGLTRQENHCHTVTHFGDGFPLARNIDRRCEMGALRVIIFRVGAENNMVR